MLRFLFFWAFSWHAAYAQNLVNSYIDLSHDDNGHLIDCHGLPHIVKDFSLPDNPSLRYRIDVLKDSVSTLSISKHAKWLVLDTLSYNTWIIADTSCTVEMPNFELTDFNEDGYTDLKIWISTNMNGNRWIIQDEVLFTDIM